MPSQHPPASVRAAKNARLQPMRVLVVTRDRQVLKLLGRRAGPKFEVLRAGTIAEARSQLADATPHLVLVDAEQPDGTGRQLAEELTLRYSQIQTIVIEADASYQNAMNAIRAGAVDVLLKPLDETETTERLDRARGRFELCDAQRRKVQRLRRVCRKLSRVHRDVKQQVDILCKDLVADYHELAVQMNQVVQSSEYAGMVREELDLEALLRKTLEFILQRAGPTNAAIFLPSNSDEFSLSGYVNYDCTSDSADFLIEQMADTVAGRVAAHREQLHLCDPNAVTAWIGDELACLQDSHLLAFSCRHEDEALAVVILFRDGSEPFDHSLMELCDGMAPLLADSLARLIRIHHRHFCDDDDDGDEDSLGSVL